MPVVTENLHAYARVSSKLRAAKCALPYLVTLVYANKVKHEQCTNLRDAANVTTGAEYWLVLDVKADRYIDELVIRKLW